MQVSARSRVGDRSDWADGIDVAAPRQARRAETGIEVKEVRIIKINQIEPTGRVIRKKKLGSEAKQRWAIRGQGAWVRDTVFPSGASPVQQDQERKRCRRRDEKQGSATPRPVRTIGSVRWQVRVRVLSLGSSGLQVLNRIESSRESRLRRTSNNRRS